MSNELGFSVSDVVVSQGAMPDWMPCRLCEDEAASPLLPMQICAACALLIHDHIVNGMTGSVAFGVTEMLRRAQLPPSPAVVYYVRRRDRIKIGTTSRFAQRMVELLPDEILAVEPGGRDIERLRHRQFAALHSVGEWFRDEPELREHVAAVVTEHGQPPAASIF